MATSLDDIDGIGPQTADKMRDVGIQDVSALAKAQVKDVEKAGVSPTRARKFINAAKESAVYIQTGDEVVSEYEQLNKIPSGVKKLDDAIDGGWREADVVGIYGESETGKTQLAFQSMVTAVEETGLDAVYIETERNRYKPGRLQQIASEDDTQSKIHRVPAYDLDRQENAYQAVVDEFDEVSIVVIDSFTARFRLSDKFDGRGTLSERSEEMGRHLRKIERMANILNCPVLYTAQVYGNPIPFGGSHVIYGGSLMQHTTSFFVHMSKGSGELVEAEIQGHPGQKKQSIELAITDKGIQSK